MNKEIWKKIYFADGYEVSNTGRVKSFKNKTPKVLKSEQGNNAPYKAVVLRIEGKSITMRIHRIVAVCFLENPDGLPCVNHIDSNKRNNHASNLEWCSHEHNVRHMVLMNRNQKQNILVLNTETGIYYDRALDAAVAHNIGPSNLYGKLGGFRKNTSQFIRA